MKIVAVTSLVVKITKLVLLIYLLLLLMSIKQISTYLNIAYGYIFFL